MHAVPATSSRHAHQSTGVINAMLGMHARNRDIIIAAINSVVSGLIQNVSIVGWVRSFHQGFFRCPVL